MAEDEKYLDLLGVFHYVVGGVTALFACFPLIHVTVGLMMMFGAIDGNNGGPPAWFGLFFAVIGGVFVLAGWALAVAMIVAGRRLRGRRSWMYCLVVAGVECMLMPFGTVLGVFTIIVLMKESVKLLFRQS